MGTARGLGVLGLLAMSTMACSTTATIYRSNGVMMEGDIEGGSPDSIVVAPKFGPRQEVARSDIAEIDHPGNVHALLGGIFLGYGIVNIAVGYEDCQGSDDAGAYCTGVFAPAAVGAGLLVWGLTTWMGSTASADDTSLPPMTRQPSPGPAPAALPPHDAVQPAAPPPTAPPPAAPPPTAPPPAAPPPATPPPAPPPADEPMVPAPVR